MGKSTNKYIEHRAEKHLDDDDRRAYEHQGASAVDNDILRSMLESSCEEDTEDDYPSELPESVFERVLSQSRALDAYHDLVRTRTNVQAPAVETAMLDLAENDLSRNALLVSATFDAAEDLVEETPAGWEAASRYASSEQRAEFGDVPRKVAKLRTMVGAASGFVRDALRVPDGPTILAPGQAVSVEVRRAIPTLQHNLGLARNYGPTSRAADILTGLAHPSVVGNEEYHVQQMLEAGVDHETVVAVMGEKNLSFSDFPNLAIAHFATQGGAADSALAAVLWKMDAREGVQGYGTKVVDLVALDNTDLFVAQLEMVKSYNALVEYRQARDVVDPRSGAPARFASQEDLDALIAKPEEARLAFERARANGIEDFAGTVGQYSAKLEPLLQTHGLNVEDAAIQGRMTYTVSTGFAPGEAGDAQLMGQAQEVAEKAVAADEAARDKAYELGEKMPANKALGPLLSWLSLVKKSRDSREKIDKAIELGLVSGAGLDATLAVNGIVKAAMSAMKDTTELLGNAFNTRADRLAGHLVDVHPADLIKAGASVTLPDPTSPEIVHLRETGDFLGEFARRAEQVALVGDALSMIGGVKTLCEGDVGAGVLDLVGGGVGMAGTLAGRMVATQGLTHGTAFGISEIAGPAGFLIAYVQLIHSTFAKMEAADKALLAQHGVETFSAIRTQVARGGAAALRASTIRRMMEGNEDPSRTASLTRELKRETRAAATALIAAHDGVVTALTPEDSNFLVYDTWVGWRAKQDELRGHYLGSVEEGRPQVRAASTTGSFESFQQGSTDVFQGMHDVAEEVKAFAKAQGD